MTNPIRKMDKTPYIGITGFTNQESVVDIISNIEIGELLADNNRLLMVGILVSYKTLNGELASNPKRYPLIEDIEKLIFKIPQILNIIHFNTRQSNLCDQLLKIHHYAPLLDGFQLNMLWPDIKQLQQYRSFYKETRIILQLNQTNIDLTSSDQELLDKIATYDMVTDLLWDMSAGHGKKIDFDQIYKYLELLTDNFPNLNLGAAGGLMPDFFPEMGNLLKAYPNLSLDIESGVRTNDILDLNKCKKYLKNYLL